MSHVYREYNTSADDAATESLLKGAHHVMDRTGRFGSDPYWPVPVLLVRFLA